MLLMSERSKAALKNSTTTTKAKSKQTTNTPGVIILQWLSYAFWGWLILGLIWLITVILINAIIGDSVNEVVPYAIAASLVLLPIAFVVDLFYRKREPVQKTGGAMVIMVVHAVLFALLAIGALVTTVFTAINLAINVPTSPNGQLVAVLTALSATILFAALFLRILNPLKSKKPSLIFGMSMLAITILLLALAIVGPIAKSINTRQDRLIEQNLPSVKSDIGDYTRANNKLPKSLSDITLSSESKELTDKNLVEYIPDLATQQTYQLCVNYIASKGQPSSRSNSYDYISTYSHLAGRVCYKLNSNINDDFSEKLNKIKSNVHDY